MSGGSKKYLQNKSWQCTDKVILGHGCSPSPIIKACIAFAGKTVIWATVLFRMLKASLHKRKWKANQIGPSTRHCREALEHLTPLVWHHDVWHMKIGLHFCVLGVL